MFIPIVLTHGEAGEEPAESTEDESLYQPDDVEQLPALNGDAVDGEEDCDGTVDSHWKRKDQEPAPGRRK